MWGRGVVLGRLSSGEHGGRMRTPAERSKALTAGCRTVVRFKLPRYSSAPSASRENVGRGGRTRNCEKKKKKTENFFQGILGVGSWRAFWGLGLPGDLDLKPAGGRPTLLSRLKTSAAALRVGYAILRSRAGSGVHSKSEPLKMPMSGHFSPAGQWQGPRGEHAGTISMYKGLVSRARDGPLRV